MSITELLNFRISDSRKESPSASFRASKNYEKLGRNFATEVSIIFT